MTGLPDLAHLAQVDPHRPPATTWAEYADTINAGIDGMERTLQTRIGPSGLGTDCLRCLARALAETPQHRDTAWLPWIGNCVHDGLEEMFAAANAGLPRVRYLTELTVSVGEVNGVDITGHLDLYDTVTGDVTDWKCVGATTLRTVKALKHKGTTKPEYRAQVHLYGRGARRRGLPVRNVRVAYLPRNTVNGLADAVVWDEPYDEQVATACLNRADALAKAIAAVGIDAILPSLTAADGCFDCPRYDPSLPKPGHKPQPRTLTDLLAG